MVDFRGRASDGGQAVERDEGGVDQARTGRGRFHLGLRLT